MKNNNNNKTVIEYEGWRLMTFIHLLIHSTNICRVPV